MNNRKPIRDAVAGLIEPALQGFNPALQVFTFKKAAPDRHDGVICIYLEEGAVSNGVSVTENGAELSIHILLPDVPDVDDQLDLIADQIEAALELDYLLGGTVTNSMHTAWNYERDITKGWTGLRLAYQLFY